MVTTHGGASVWIALALRYSELGLPAAARSVCARILASESENEIRAAAHRVLANLGAEDAFRHAELAMELAPGPDNRLLVAQTALQAGRAGFAFSLLFESTSLASEEDSGTLLTLAMAAASRGDGPRAWEAMERLLALDLPSDQRTAEGMVEVAHLLGKLEVLEARGRAQGSSSGLFVAALAAEARGAEEEETAALLEAAKGPSARLALALRWARRRGRDAKAREQAEAGLEALLEEGPPSLSRARLQLLLASIRDDDAQQHHSAERAYRDALRELPREVLACNNLGVIALGRSDLDEAIFWFKEAVRREPGSKPAYLNLARALLASDEAALPPVLDQLWQLDEGAERLADLMVALVDVVRQDVQQSLAGRGHQLKNLLGVVGSRVRTTARRVEDEGLRAKLAKASEQLATAYDDWGAFLRSMREESGTVDALDINTVVNEAVRGAGAPVELKLAGRLPDVRGLKGQLREALVNVIRNGLEAHQAAPASRPLELSVETRLASGGKAVEVVVRDSGPGIPLSTLRRVRTPGFTTKKGGSGIGLSICDRVMRDHGGRLELMSGDQGTEVRMILPLRLDAQMRHGMLAGLAEARRGITAQEVVVEE